MGLSYALTTSTLFQIIIKLLIGGLRPHFLAACQPDLSKGIVDGSFGIQMYNRKTCTGDEWEVNNALQSFPSGHAAAAFAGLLFLALYLNAKLKIFADYHSRVWKLLLFALPLELALLMALSKIIDYWHFWYDVLFGSLIGCLFALLGYRMVYSSVWDWRYGVLIEKQHEICELPEYSHLAEQTISRPEIGCTPSLLIQIYHPRGTIQQSTPMAGIAIGLISSLRKENLPLHRILRKSLKKKR
jgi:membrane-associated phospholipid phosphatase